MLSSIRLGRWSYSDLRRSHWTTFWLCLAIEDEFTTEILAKFHNDNIGKLCRSEPAIVLIGRRRFQRNRGKVDKLMEIKKSVMTEMRLLSKRHIAFSEAALGSNISTKDMFVRTNFNVLEVAIEQVMTAESSVLKRGVKNGLYYDVELNNKGILHLLSVEKLGHHCDVELSCGRRWQQRGRSREVYPLSRTESRHIVCWCCVWHQQKSTRMTEYARTTGRWETSHCIKNAHRTEDKGA